MKGLITIKLLSEVEISFSGLTAKDSRRGRVRRDWREGRLPKCFIDDARYKGN